MTKKLTEKRGDLVAMVDREGSGHINAWWFGLLVKIQYKLDDEYLNWSSFQYTGRCKEGATHKISRDNNDMYNMQDASGIITMTSKSTQKLMEKILEHK